MNDSLQALLKVQAQIIQYRRVAASGHLDPGLARLLRDLADGDEARARRLDAQAAD